MLAFFNLSLFLKLIASPKVLEREKKKKKTNPWQSYFPERGLTSWKGPASDFEAREQQLE